MPTLLLDNYDSYTFNLFQLLGQVDGEEPLVVRNDELTPAALDALHYDAVVISPGPGHPQRPRDFGICEHVARHARVPLLGVCLGHQGIAAAHGAEVTHAPSVAHGRVDTIRHTGAGIFAGLPQQFAAVRYHSLAVREPLPPELEAVAWSSDGVLMALRHRTRPLWGVQFHPESIGTEHGRALLEAFLTLRGRRPAPLAASRSTAPPTQPARTGSPTLRVHHRELAAGPEPERAFLELYATSPAAFWLDSSRSEAGLSRWSFMGDASGPCARVVRYRIGEPLTEVSRHGERRHDGTIFEYLRRELDAAGKPDVALPFDFTGGFVGYLGYELKALCGSEPVHRSDLPDAQFLFADRLIAFDHDTGAAHLVALAPERRSADAAAWIEDTAARLATLAGSDEAQSGPPPPPVARTGAAAAPAATPTDAPTAAATAAPTAAPAIAPTTALDRSTRGYADDVAQVKRWLVDGETFELCLTAQLELDALPDPLGAYLALRRRNPAPYGAFLRFGDEAAILSSSPERFLRIDRERRVESRPIKGTAARRADPAADAAARAALAASAKDRAENLMIADLLRNDLGRVCQPGTVTVPELMAVRTYATVHHLVTTVQGLLRDDLDAIDAIQAAFPAGSMTGAPKLRTMELIDRLEPVARGPYAGALGWLSPTGAADLSVVIRTLVQTSDRATVGAGGAIVAASDAATELAELELKARAVLDVLAEIPGSAPHAISCARAGAPS